MPCDAGPAPLWKEGCLRRPHPCRVYSGLEERRPALSGCLPGLCFLCAFLWPVGATLCRPFPRDGFHRRQSWTDGQTVQLPFCPREDLRGAGAGRGVAPPHFCSELQLLPVFTFRTNTFLWWPGSLFIFETSVSKRHISGWWWWSPREGCLDSAGFLGASLRLCTRSGISQPPRASAWTLLAWPGGAVSVLGSGLDCSCCLSA